MHLTRVRVKRVGQGEDAAAWAKALEDPAWPKTSQVLKQEGGSWVRRATLRGRDVVVKCRPLTSVSRRIKSVLGLGHADKHWRGAKTLMSIGVATARPFVSARAAIDDGACELLVLEYLSGQSLLEVMNAIANGNGPRVREQHAIARAVAKTVNTLLDGKKWNRDHKPSNLIVTHSSADAAGIAVIDCVGIRPYAWWGMDEGEGELMLASLLIESTGCGCPPRLALRMSSLRAVMVPRVIDGPRRARHADMKELIGEIDFIVTAHGDPRPKVNPLADR